MTYDQSIARADLYGPTTGGDELDEERLKRLIVDVDDAATTPLVRDEQVRMESMRVANGRLEFSLYFETPGLYANMTIPLQSNSALRDLVREFEECAFAPCGFELDEILRRDVDSHGRVSVGTERSGESLRLAVLE